METELLDTIAERFAKKETKNVMRKVSKIVFKALKEEFNKVYNTEYRCKECTKSEFD